LAQVRWRASGQATRKRCLNPGFSQRIGDSRRTGIAKIQSEIVVHPFIVAYGYQENIEKLIAYYRRKRSPYKNWVFPVNVGADRYQPGVRSSSSKS
jgi:hypothetical protein